jgi:transcriptional regulator with XRE-family HTH domain
VPSPNDPIDPAAAERERDQQEALGRAILLRRTELALSRRELAEAAGLSYPFVSALERGRRAPSVRTLHRLAGALGTTVADLEARADELVDHAAVDPVASRALVERLLREALHDEVRSEVARALGGDGAAAAPPGVPTTGLDVASTPYASIRERVEDTLRRFLEVDELVVDDDGDIPIRHGTAMVFIRPLEEPATVLCFSPVLVDVKDSAALYEELNDLNTRSHFLTWSYHDGAVLASIEVFGEPFEPRHLVAAHVLLASAADDLDEELRERFGGNVFFGEDAPPKPPPGAAGYL